MEQDKPLLDHCHAREPVPHLALPKELRSGVAPGHELLAVGLGIAMRAEDLRPVAGLGGRQGPEKRHENGR